MTTDESHARLRQSLQRLRAQQSELSVADYDGARAFVKLDALRDGARRRERLGEDRALVRHFVGDGQQIHDRQLQEFCERAVAPDDAEDCARRAVARITCAAQLTDAAACIYLADDAATRQFRSARRAFDHAYELVSERALKARVAAHDL